MDKAGTIDSDKTRPALCSNVALLVYMALFTLLLHFALNGRYGYQRDELYFIDCGEHLDFGYVDIGPMSIWLGLLGRKMLGESLFALRFFPAVAGALSVLFIGLFAHELGGRRFAQCLAALCYIVAPIWLGSGNLLALSAFEPLYWLLASYCVLRVLKTGNSKLWLGVGVMAGIGLLNKPSMLFFGLGLTVGLLLTPQRKYLLDKWLWIGGLIALVIASPYIYWQTLHGWATVQFMVGMNATVMSRIPRLIFVIGQLFYMHPFNTPIWAAGLAYYFGSRDGKPYRALGWIFVTAFVLLVAVQSKIYYLAPAYVMLFPAGAVIIERFLAARDLRWPRVAIPAALIAGGAVTAPIALPILPIEKVDGYINGVTFGALKNAYEITYTFHDMMGWENQVATVAKVFHSLTPEQQAACVVFAPNFGRAGAIDFYGPKYGLPKATSVHQNYYFWGPPETTGEVTLVVGARIEHMQMFFEDIQQVDTITCKECVPFESNVPVYLCRKPKMSLKDAWPSLRRIAFLN